MVRGRSDNGRVRYRWGSGECKCKWCTRGFRFQLKFNYFELDSEAGRLVQKLVWAHATLLSLRSLWSVVIFDYCSECLALTRAQDLCRTVRAQNTWSCLFEIYFQEQINNSQQNVGFSDCVAAWKLSEDRAGAARVWRTETLISEMTHSSQFTPSTRTLNS